jgi:hypothetical protein
MNYDVLRWYNVIYQSWLTVYTQQLHNNTPGNNILFLYGHCQIILQPNKLKDFGSRKTKGSKQESQNLGAIKPKGLNRRAKIWEQENQRV